MVIVGFLGVRKYSSYFLNKCIVYVMLAIPIHGCNVLERIILATNCNRNWRMEDTVID